LVDFGSVAISVETIRHTRKRHIRNTLILSILPIHTRSASSLEELVNYRALLRKMTYKDKASYGSSPVYCDDSVSCEYDSYTQEANRVAESPCTLLVCKAKDRVAESPYKR
jgi:hypothetical protein